MSRFSTSVSASQTKAADEGGSSTGAVRALIGEVQREAVKVRVDIASRVQRMSLAQLPSKCHPESKPTNKLATARAKAQKEEQVAVPFPYMDVAEFLPPWAEDVCIAFIRALTLLQFMVRHLPFMTCTMYYSFGCLQANTSASDCFARAGRFALI